jgi:2-oxo-3-hexenedioate decarboxylase
MPWELLAAELADARKAGRSVAPPSQRFDGFGLADGYQVGRLLAERRVGEGHPPVGMKIGLTNAGVWPRLGITHPVWAPIYDVHTDREFSLNGLTAPRLEVEVVAGLVAAVPVGSTVDQVTGAIGWVALGFEIVDCHYPDWKLTPADLLADHGVHVALLLGPRQVLLSAKLAELSVTLCRDGAEVASGHGRDVLGGPAAAIAAVSGAPLARDLDAGEIVSTGALTGGSHPVAPGQEWFADSSAFARLKVVFR